MSLDADQVRVAATGRVYVDDEGATAPSDSGTAPDAAYVDMGYVTEDGVTLTFDRTTEDVNAWQGTKLRVITTDEPASVAFALMETDMNTLPVVYGGGTVGGAADDYTFTPPGKGDNAIRSMIIDWEDGDIVYRYYFPRVQIEGSVEQTFAANAPLTYPLTFGVLDNDPKWSMFTNDPAMGVAAPLAAPAAKKVAAPQPA